MSLKDSLSKTQEHESKLLSEKLENDRQLGKEQNDLVAAREASGRQQQQDIINATLKQQQKDLEEERAKMTRWQRLKHGLRKESAWAAVVAVVLGTLVQALVTVYTPSPPCPACNCFLNHTLV